ncbi:HEAT repeat domain-containing protein [Kitasatospora sp. NPDC096147]|uniref:HEAT repeat domain-containing protein n=1 Tax=Kitasatospora sp. NPDC096147 TaxID=3364093 RepID=UPI00381BA03B
METVGAVVGWALAAARAGEEYRKPLWRAAADAASALALGRELTGSADAIEREVGAALVGDAADHEKGLGAEAATVLLALAGRETADAVPAVLPRALGQTEDRRALPAVLALAGHSEAVIRREVACSLSSLATGLPDGPDVRALIALTRDRDPEVRNWATFTLGFLYELDTVEVRAVLWERTADDFPDVREEGIRGLARRHDPGAIALVAELLADPEGAHVHTFAAAEILGVPELLPYLEDYDPDDPGVSAAVRACDPEQRGRLDALAWALVCELARLAPESGAGVYRERFGPDLRVGAGGVAWDVEALLRRAGGDPVRAAGLAVADLA